MPLSWEVLPTKNVIVCFYILGVEQFARFTLKLLVSFKKIAKHFEESDFFVKGVTETTENEAID